MAAVQPQNAKIKSDCKVEKEQGHDPNNDYWKISFCMGIWKHHKQSWILKLYEVCEGALFIMMLSL